MQGSRGAVGALERIESGGVRIIDVLFLHPIVRPASSAFAMRGGRIVTPALDFRLDAAGGDARPSGRCATAPPQIPAGGQRS